MPKLIKTQTGTITIRMPIENIEALKMKAEEDGVSLSWLLRSSLNRTFQLPVAV